MSTQPRRIAIVVGIRPHFVKLAAIRPPLAVGNDVVVIHTGQHYDPAMTTDLLAEAGLPEPDHVCDVGSGSHARQTAAALVALEQAFLDCRPDLVLTIGDGNSSLAAALAAVQLGLPTAHLEAGVRSFDRTLPEEINRIAIDGICDLHLTTTPSAHARLLGENPAVPPVFVGDPLLDVLLARWPLLTEVARTWANELSDRPTVFATFHRAGTLADPRLLANVVQGITSIDADVVCALHPGTEKALRRNDLLDVLKNTPSVRLLPALGHLDLLGLILACDRVLTDSNGVQRESLYLGRYCSVMRDSTEFPETLRLGAGALVGTDPDAIATAPPSTVDIDVAEVRRVFGDGAAGRRLAVAVEGALA